jgi:3-oxoacyl-[acyl-carrier-protein] synthase-3
MGFKIVSIESYFPKKREIFRNKKIIKITGIKQRYIASLSESVIQMGYNSAKKIIRGKKINFDFLLFVTQTSPYKFPSAACVLQNKLGLGKNIFSIDINMGCSGFIYALSVSKALFSSHKDFKNGLIICAENYTKYINNKNKSCLPIFSDASTATHVKRANKEVSKFSYGTDGSGYKDLILENSKNNMFMNGSKVALFTLYTIPKFISVFLKKIKLNLSTIDMFVFHQASRLVLENLRRKLNIDNQKFPKNLNKYGNTVSSTIPLLLRDLNKSKKINNNDKILLVGYGVGLSWAACYLKWKRY